jgi:hypothetical protein
MDKEQPEGGNHAQLARRLKDMAESGVLKKQDLKALDVRIATKKKR